MNRAMKFLLLFLVVSMSLSYAVVMVTSLPVAVSPTSKDKTKADDVVWGVIVDKTEFFVNIDGEDFEFTTIRIEGTSLYTHAPTVIDVTYAGGVTQLTGDMPSYQETQIDNEVVAFTAQCGEIADLNEANVLACCGNGVFMVTENANEEKIVIGKGLGSAIEETMTVNQLISEINTIRNGG